jgi:branched-chain amino acid transport system substrate-binding protein
VTRTGAGALPPMRRLPDHVTNGARTCDVGRMTTVPELCIGVVAPFSTEEAVVADPLLAAVTEVVEASNLPVRVIALDDGRDPARSAEAVAAVLSEPGCIGLVGPKNSGCALAAAPLAAAAGVPLVLPCATADELTGEGGIVFRLCCPDRATAAAAVALAIEIRVDRLAVLADDTAYGQGLAGTVRAAGASAGISLAESVAGSDAVFLAMGEVEQSILMRELRANGYRGEFISAEGGPQAPIATLAGPVSEGAWLLYPGTPVRGRSVYAAEAADAARILLAAGTGGPDAIRAGTFDGETGRIRFTTAGERDGAVVSRYRVVDGAVRRVDNP